MKGHEMICYNKAVIPIIHLEQLGLNFAKILTFSFIYFCPRYAIKHLYRLLGKKYPKGAYTQTPPSPTTGTCTCTLT